MALIAKIEQEANDQELVTTALANPNKVMALMMMKVQIKMKNKKRRSNMMLVSVTYQALQKCNKSSFRL